MLILWLGVLSVPEKELINELFKDSNVMLYNISLKYLRSSADAEDAVAQSFVRIIDHIDKISSLPCPQRLPYCVIIAKNVCIDMLRKRKTITMELDDVAEDVPDTSDAFWSTIERSTLLEAMSLLSVADRQLLQLRYANEMSYKDIAAIGGITEESAKKRGQRAVARLRKIYEEGGHHVSV